MIKSLLFLAFVVFSAACMTTQISQKESFIASGIDYIDCSVCDDGNACTTDTCSNEGCAHENIVCNRSEKLCADGYLAGCSNYCDNGVCTSCEPLCEEHGCKEISKQCNDGSKVFCKEKYVNNSCAPCEPQCTCTPRYSCSEWADCINGMHTRICVDANKCAVDRKETKDCTAMIKEEQVAQIPSQPQTQTTQQSQQSQNVYFLEIMYDPSGEETKEEYVVLSGNGDVSGWTISDNSGSWSIPQGTVINGKLMIARNSDAFKSVYGCTAHVSGFTRGLNNDGDQLTLKDNNGSQKDFVAWEKGASDTYPDWTVTAGEGNALRKNGAWHEASPSPC